MLKRNHCFVIALMSALLMACGGGGESAEAPEMGADKGASAEPAGMEPDLSQAGGITGKVNFKGESPRMLPIRMGAEPQCQEKHSGRVYSAEVVVNGNATLKNVFVWVKSGLEKYRFESPQEPATLDQEGCIYQPHVFGVRTNQEIRILNNDPVTHNIHPLPQNNREWNTSQSPNQDIVRSFPRQEIMIPVKCNIHPWMKSYIGVVDHPYFSVTGDDGSFELSDLPPGDYTVEAWHERYGTQEQQITIGAKESKQIEFTFGG